MNGRREGPRQLTPVSSRLPQHPSTAVACGRACDRQPAEAHTFHTLSNQTQTLHLGMHAPVGVDTLLGQNGEIL
jgi:hypothetical protein